MQRSTTHKLIALLTILCAFWLQIAKTASAGDDGLANQIFIPLINVPPAATATPTATRIPPTPTVAPTQAPPTPTPTPMQGVFIENANLSVIDGYLRYTGEVVRRGDYVECIDIGMVFYDAAGTIVAVVDRSDVALDHLYDNWRAPFIVERSDLPAFDHYTASVEIGGCTVLYPDQFFDVEVHSVTREDNPPSGTFITMIGVATNNTDIEPSLFGYIYAIGRDATGTIVVVGNGFIDDLHPHTPVPFEEYVISFYPTELVNRVVTWEYMNIFD